MTRILELLAKLVPITPEMLEGVKVRHKKEGYQEVVSEIIPCDSYEDLVSAWQVAMKWTPTLDCSLSTLLSCIASTRLQGDQIWFRLIGVAGTAKSTLCEGLAKNVDHVFPMSMLTGLHSGYTGAGAGEDASIIPRLKNKTLVVNEGDMILKAPNRDQIMAELRDLYTGVARCHYRNGKEVHYTGLRISVIIAGTPTLRALNRSALGDRFLDCVIQDKQEEKEKRKLVKGVLDDTMEECLTESTDEATTQEDPKKVYAQQKTAGYIRWLRENIATTLGSEEWRKKIPPALAEDCEHLGLLVAAMRTRSGLGEEEDTEKELHIRLSKQLRKLAICLAFVMNRPIDGEVMKRVAKVAKDTCYGNTYKVVQTLYEKGPLDIRGLASRLGMSDDRVKKAVNVLVSIDCVRPDTLPAASGATGRGKNIYRLSVGTKGLMDRLKKLLGGTLE